MRCKKCGKEIPKYPCNECGYNGDDDIQKQGSDSFGEGSDGSGTGSYDSTGPS